MWQCQYSSRFLVHSSDQCKVCPPSDIIACDAGLSSPFWNTASNQNLRLEKAWKPGCAFCLQCTLQLSLLSRLSCLPLPQTPTVVSISGSLVLLMEYLDTVLPQIAKQIKTWTNKDTVQAQMPSQEPKGGVQQNWRRKESSVLDGCSTTGKRASNPGTA